MPHKSAPQTGATSVPALRRTVAIMDYLSAPSQPPTMAEIARALNMPKSTTHGLLLAMEELRLISRTPGGGLRLGTHPLRWADGFLAQTDLITCFTEYFSVSHDLAHFTVTMTILDQDEVLYIACTQGDQPLGVTFRIGMRLPAAFTATGKALLADLPECEISDRFATDFPPPLTQHSVTTLTALHDELAVTRKRGFSIDDGQVRPGMICLGAVIRNHAGNALAGIAVSLTRSEATEAMVATLGQGLKNAAQAISDRLGYQSAP